MDPPSTGEDRTTESPRDEYATPPVSIQDAIDALRPPLVDQLPSLSPGRSRRHDDERLSSWPIQLLIGALVALMVWPLAAWDPSEESVDTAVAGQLLEARPSTSTSGTAPTTALPAVDTSTTTTPPSAVTAPIAVPPTTEPPPPPRSSTTSTATTAPTSTTTTTPPPPKPKPISPQSTSQVFPGVQLAVAAVPPPGSVRTARFSLVAEFGDARVLRSVHFELGDGTVAAGTVVPWGCRDPDAPNPYVLSGPTHAYLAPGSYPVTVTVRTAPCIIGSDDTLPEETAQVELTLVVP